MIKRFEYANGIVNITINEKPMYSDLEVEFKKIMTNIKSLDFQRLPNSLGLEIGIHKGGRIYYGLLSTSILPSCDVDTTYLTVSFTKRNIRIFENSILLNNNHIYEGLPEEYLDAVINGAFTSITEINRFPLCNIAFDHAANCTVGSSPMFFEKISGAIIDLIFLSHKNELSIETCDEYLLKKFNLRTKMRE